MNDCCSWSIYKTQLPVTCGKEEGTLIRDRLAKGEKCILVKKQWFTPTEFEKFAGKGSYKNWRQSIRCMGIQLGKLIRDKKTQLHFNNSTANEEPEEMEEQGEQQPHTSPENHKKKFKVTCGALSGTLYEKRFASGTCGKSIRTETSWMTPVEFTKAASDQPDVSWKKDIDYDGKPLNALIEAKVLEIHSLLCSCRLCKPKPQNVEDDKNDDECFICKSDKENLVECDWCPKSFHQKCHLPHVDDKALRADIYPSVSNKQECQYLLLYLRSADDRQIFAINPCLYLEDYSSLIETPMWLCRIAEKLEKKQYQTVGQFVSDVQLIFTNCSKYNQVRTHPWLELFFLCYPDEHLVIGYQLKQLFDTEFKKAFSIP
ncbi:nuclear body protein SP140-like protein [Xenentodon cancila]